MTVQDKTFDHDLALSDAGRTASFVEQVRVGGSDIVAGLKMWRLWTLLGWNDIRQRYRRSLIGPFWITLSMAIFTMLLGVIYSYLFKMNVAVYLPYVAMGLVAWGFISGTITEACGVFAGSTSIIQQIRLPYTLHLLRSIWRSFIVLLHTIVLIVPIMILTPVDLAWVNLWVLPGLALVFMNQLWISIVVAVVSTRFRDIAQLVATAIQVSMFATPIMYPVGALGAAHLVAEVNPFYHLVSLIRDPLLGTRPALLSFEVVLGLCAVGYFLAAYLMHRASRRLVYWL